MEPTPFLILFCVGIIGMVGVGLAAPLIFQIGGTLESLSILLGGVGEYLGRPSMFRGCCLIGAMLGVGGCGLIALLLLGIVGCLFGMGNPTCGLIGR